MTETKFLDGKVLKRSLPVLEPGPGQPMLAVKRLLLAQGELAQFYDGDLPIRYLAYIELRAGTLRGNHYHHTKEEFIYVIRGELSLIVEDLQSHARDQVQLQTGDLVQIPTGIAHALQVTSSGQAIEFSSARFDPADTHRCHLVGTAP